MLPLLPGDLKLREFGQKFSSVEQASDHFGMREGAGERVVRVRFFGDTAVVEDGVEIEGTALVLHGRLEAVGDVVHVAQGVRVDRSICEGPIGVSGALGSVAEKVAIERNVLPCEGPLFEPFAPCEE